MRSLKIAHHTALREALTVVAIAAAGLIASTAIVLAGECPADKVVAEGQKPGATAPKGVTDEVLSSIDLAAWPLVEGRQLRLRKLVIQPGGEVPWHSHADRPAIIYVVDGEVTEYASTCAVPILHKAGSTSTESKATAHWWKNTGSTTATLLSADLFHVAGDPHQM